MAFLLKMSLIYSPEEDSYLLEEVLKKEIPKLENFKEKSYLEVGIGSGIQMRALKEMEIKNIFGVDLNLNAVKYCQNLGFNCIESNLFEKVKENFDVIIFNPPYLPKSKREDEESELITTGGKNGSEIINKFLEQAKIHLNQGGKIYLLISSLTKKINWLNYKKKLIGEKKLFFEKLEVWELFF